MKKSPEKSDLKKELASVRKEFETMRHNLVKATSYLNKLITESSKTYVKQEEFLRGIKSTNENIEDTLLNVLLAIRQNEYLQAWYPQQQGYPAMKVAGTHPAKLQRK